MSAEITRRGFAAGFAAATLATRAGAQGFAGLGTEAQGFAPVVPGRPFSFPTDHGPHPDFRIEWWYLTANLRDAAGTAYGVQWTLFRQAMRPGPQQEGWDNQQVWMGHAAATSATTHRFAETYARGGVEQAGVEISPFTAWIDAWEMKGLPGIDPRSLSPLMLEAAGADFSYALTLEADRPVVLQGEAGYSRKSERGQASYYYSQPFFHARGRLAIEGRKSEVTGEAWLDREWSSQPLAADQTGWDWFALHLASGEKLMIYRLRQKDDDDYPFGTWIAADGSTRQIAGTDVQLAPGAPIDVAGHRLPVEWRITIPPLNLSVSCKPLNARSWMGSAFSYWEGPISFSGSHEGVGYLEMTGY